ncbi:ATP-dependent Clp protease [Coniochaeta ligniaria NRRL 30616]|uniref:ATP-dependent Clp protease n=1 Tax=Coniochaeta ligniaria NRRL 30616 TaxID=1408157 RepID=A0A1J7IJR0_9PEZI|nr:ATP-dependent Clp protease [Coniochaeta ligniaria NRRL 30616]
MTVLTRPRCASLAVLSSTLIRRPPPLVRSRPRTLTTSSVLRTTYRRSEDFTSGFSSSYDPSQDTGRGPMFSKATFGVPNFYPRDLKKRVDEYVVGQDRAKKTICSVIFNHYQNLRRRQHHEFQDQRLREKLQRQRFARDRDLHERQGYADVHPVEDEFPGHNESVRGIGLGSPEPVDEFYIPEDLTVPQHVKIDKSNLLLLGPTGVGKTYILETLSKKLNVPFTISDCNSFTQAGYIGQDVETCIERLLIEANYDTKATEHGIVVLDEFDKIARRETVNGRDVGGEGVQQALLKLVEGTKVTINVKDNRSSRPSSPLMGGGGGPAGNSTGQPGGPPPSGKVDQYTIDTTNILFVFCGAFVGLDKAVLKRVAKHSMGFGAELRRAAASSLQGSSDILPAEVYAHLPHQPPAVVRAPDSPTTKPSSGGFTPLDLTTPTDLQAFGFIPELIGRVHNICALTPLSLDELFRILTEPRNSLVAQYTALFETYPSRLSFTRRALRAIAERAAKNETGARGLKMEMERVLAEPMFDAPTPYVLITEGCVRGTEKAGYWGKDGGMEVERRVAEEDEGGKGRVVESSFEQFREAGLSGA